MFSFQDVFFFEISFASRFYFLLQDIFFKIFSSRKIYDPKIFVTFKNGTCMSHNTIDMLRNRRLTTYIKDDTFLRNLLQVRAGGEVSVLTEEDSDKAST